MRMPDITVVSVREVARVESFRRNFSNMKEREGKKNSVAGYATEL